MTVETDELVLDLALRLAEDGPRSIRPGAVAELDPLDAALAQLLGEGAADLRAVPAVVPSAALADVLAGRAQPTAPPWTARVASAVAGLGLAAKVALGAGVAAAALGVAHHEHLLPAPLQHLLDRGTGDSGSHRPARVGDPTGAPGDVSDDPSTAGTPSPRTPATPGSPSAHAAHSARPAQTTGPGGAAGGADDDSRGTRGSTGATHDDGADDGAEDSSDDGPRGGSARPEPSTSAGPRDGGDDDGSPGRAGSEAPEPSDTAEPSDTSEPPGSDDGTSDGSGHGVELPGADAGSAHLPDV